MVVASSRVSPLLQGSFIIHYTSSSSVGLTAERDMGVASACISPLQYWWIYSALKKYSSPLAFFLFCCITTCKLNIFLIGFHAMDIHKIGQIGEVKKIYE